MTNSKVQDVMTRSVVTVRDETPFKELVRIMHENGVSGVPVVDEAGLLVGIVTEADLLKAGRERTPRPRNAFLEWFIHPSRLARIEEQAGDLRARDLMTTDVVTVRPGTLVTEAVRILLDADVKRLPVLDETGRVVGIASRGDLLAPFLRGDAEIRREIAEDVLLRTMWIDPAPFDIRVDDGVVRIEGTVENRSTKEILLEFVRRVDGVVGVVDCVDYHVDDRKVKPPARSWTNVPGAIRVR